MNAGIDQTENELPLEDAYELDRKAVAAILAAVDAGDQVWLTQLTEPLPHARNCNVPVKEAGADIVFLHRLEPGGTDRSYGVHVARLAGLPHSVVHRAWEILALLESGHHVAGRTPPPPLDAAQLGLFATEEHPALQELRQMDPNSMTPIEALGHIADLKRMTEEQ